MIIEWCGVEVSQLGRWDYFVHHPVAKEQFLPFLQACTQGKTRLYGNLRDLSASHP
jgi:hypothetical protein